MLWAIGAFLTHTQAPVAPVLPPLDARIIELPAIKAEVKPQSETQAKSAVTPKSAPAPVPKPIQPHPVTPNNPAPPKVNLPPAPTLPAMQSKTELPVPAPAPVAPKPASHPASGASGTQQMGAHAIYQPNPVLPEDLRDETMHLVIKARFHIAEDGSVTVELLKSAPDPRVNQIILNTLKTWRFFPATQADKPVSSTQDVNISIDVGD